MNWDLLQYFPEEMITVSIERGQIGSYVNSVWSQNFAAAAVDFECIAFQPLSASEIKMLPEGEHVMNFVKTYSKEEVNTRRDGIDADIITNGNKKYKVFQADNRDVIGGFRKVILREITEDEQ